MQNYLFKIGTISSSVFKVFMVLILVLIPTVAVAQITPATTNKSLAIEGLGIDPFLIEVDAEIGTSIERSITVTNTTGERLSFEASINDFIPNVETGQAQFLSADEESDSKYSLNRWIKITQQPEFTLDPYESTEVKFVITPPANAEPGTHYGGILFGRPAQDLGNESHTAVQQKVGSILLVKFGKSQEQVQLNSFKTARQVYQSAPYEFEVSLRNDGNVHSKPKGDITIRNIFGKEIEQAAVNRDASVVLPNTSRSFESQYFGNLGIGRYTAELIMYYGNQKLELRAQTVFWVLPAKKIGLGVLALTILCIILYIGIKRYNRYIINHSR